MIFRLMSLILLTSGLLTGCVQTATTTRPLPKPDLASCDALGFSHLIGKPDVALSMIALPKNHRILHPGQVMTMDYQSDRVNIMIGKDKRIERITCG